MEIYKAKNKDDAARKAIQMVNACLREAKKNPVLLMVSGGSAFNLLHGINAKNLGKHITISVLDERFSEDPKISNFVQLAGTEFYRKAGERGVSFIDTRPRAGETVEELAKRFEKGLREWRERNSKGKVIITQGVGEDGHTAGIMPYPENPKLFKRLFDDSSTWVVGYDAGEKNEYALRVTITHPFLRDVVDHSIIYAVGEGKREALRRVFLKEGTLWETPARIIHEMKDVKLFTDV